ncbi:MAG: carboxylating nicotinate-nucleotide diphosphorylase [Bacteroidales bacterium]|nr:carboxylating nicotinate-nucleotide diphosphorylase [Bacteroidales bacterium]MCF8337158.1 carboxylating nicotinate-nucleotide diphosphorylase [Bacteroidales bacterium]
MDAQFWKEADKIIDRALEEDLGDGDHTSLSTIPADAEGKARLVARENGVLAGVDIARKVFKKVDSNIRFEHLKHDGDELVVGDEVFEVEGASVSLLSAERLALNFLQRMSGIATATRQLSDLIEGSNCKILDTRKTTPNLRILEKYSVKTGGGENHRFGLYDMILIKDNHIDFAGGIKQAIEACQNYLKEKEKDLKIEVEVRNFKELEHVLQTGGVTRIMLDNFSPDDLKKAVKYIDGRFETEASGGITNDTIRDYAKAGVDYISVGALTHHIKSLDLSMKAIT